MSLRIQSFLTLQNRCAKAMVTNFHQNNTHLCYGKCFSNRCPPRDANSVMAVGLRAGNTRYTFIMAGVSPAVVRDGSLQHLVHYGDEYYFSTFVGRARTNLTKRWQALFAWYSALWGCWPSGFPINVMRIITKPGDQHRYGFGLGYGYPGKIRYKRKQRVCFIYRRISGGSRNGPGRELNGAIWEDPYSKTATGQKTLNTGRGPYLRGPADDVMLRQYGACDICQSFSDVVCVTTHNRRLHLQATVPVPCVITASRVSITKAVGP